MADGLLVKQKDVGSSPTGHTGRIELMSSTDLDRLDAREKRNASTQLLLDNARKSLEEVAELTGMSTSEVAEKYARLYEDRGWMTERMEERHMLIELGDVLEDAKNRLKNVSDDNYASVARIVLGTLTAMFARIDARKKLVDDDISEITRANARQFGDAYDLALNHVVYGLRQLHPDITDDEVLVLSREGLAKAKERLNSKVRR